MKGIKLLKAGLIGLLFSAIYLFLYVYPGINPIKESILLASIPFVYSIMFFYWAEKRNYALKDGIKFSAILSSIICLAIYLIAIPFTSGEVIGGYLIIAPLVFIIIYIIPTALLSYLILKFVHNK